MGEKKSSKPLATMDSKTLMSHSFQLSDTSTGICPRSQGAIRVGVVRIIKRAAKHGGFSIFRLPPWRPWMPPNSCRNYSVVGIQ